MNAEHRPTARWSGGRALAFGAVSAGVGVFGHAYAQAMGPCWDVLVVATALLALYARAFAGDRIRPLPMLLGVTVAQLLVHGACWLVRPASGHHDHHHATAAPPSTLLMLAVHVVAIVLGVALLLRLEHHVWRPLRAVARLVRRLGGRAPEQVVVALPAARPRLARTARAVPAERRWISRSTGRRGPPARALAV